MPLKFKFANLLPAFSNKWLKLKFIAEKLLIYLCVSFLAFAPMQSAYAAKNVIVEYESNRITVPFKQLQKFAKTGTANGKLKDFLDTIPLDTESAPALLNGAIPQTGLELNQREIEFLLIQVNKLVGSPLGEEVKGVTEKEPLAVALRDASLNNNLSFIEIARLYPEKTVKMNLKKLNTVHRDATFIMERLDKFLTAFGPLQAELICGCSITNNDSQISDFPNSKIIAEKPLNKSIKIKASKLDSQQKPETSLLIASAIKQQPAIYDAELKSTEIDENNQLVSENIAENQDNSTPSNRRVSQKVVFALGLLQESLDMDDLTNFAATGEVPRGWNTYFKLLKLDPEEFRGLLTTESKMEMKFLDGILNNLIGEYILFQVGQVIHGSTGKANIQGLRSALILSAAGDNKISMLEILQNYPSQKVVLEGMRLVKAAKSFKEKGIVKGATVRLEDILVDLQQFGVKEDCKKVCPTDNRNS